VPAEVPRAPRRVSRKGVLGLCARLEGSPGRSEYARGRCRLVGEQEAVEILPPFPLALEASGA
jgi:hypothetical protein